MVSLRAAKVVQLKAKIRRDSQSRVVPPRRANRPLELPQVVLLETQPSRCPSLSISSRSN